MPTQTSYNVEAVSLTSEYPHINMEAQFVDAMITALL